ncbi:MAG: hypothetical protein KJ914_01120 [Gammaproteobacteria bacterium]|nr:hypothetical protein [Gammaproteobacteria bacterium]MBU1722943.1 hypothetical protein [Gammaproteobacteria bacterium]MBU2005680.1 hypothetical protein [Gammaproteobacteria bacterium]
MSRKGFRIGCCTVLALLVWLTPAVADETADEITLMMAWWDEYGSYWDEAEDLIEFTSDEPGFMLADADNTMEASE